jgi:hypothetical protein
MKYLKTFESSNRLKIGNYVLCEEYGIGYEDKATKLFIKNNIGKYIMYDKTAKHKYVIEYENIPDSLRYVDFFRNPITGERNVRWMNRTEIIKFEKNKIELELFLKMDKYNL